MSRYFLANISVLLRRFENLFPQLFGRGYPPDAFCLAGTGTGNEFDQTFKQSLNLLPQKYSIKDLIGDGILWAVPKHRRSIEKRLKRKYGSPEYVLKILTPKTNLRVCNKCGHDHEVGILCRHCYDRVRGETELMQDEIQNQLGLEPIEQEVVVLYKGERNKQPSEFLNGKRVIEMDRPRPMWFSRNLMQKTTQQPATTKEVKPDELG